MRPLSEFRAEVEAKAIAEQGRLRWTVRRLRARWQVNWWLLWNGHKPLPPVSQEAFDLVAHDTEALDAITNSRAGQ